MYKKHPKYNLLVYQDGRIFGLRYKKFIGYIHNDGYVMVCVGNKQRKKAHQLVMELWGPPKPTDIENPVIDHIDTNPLNNHIDNLRWLSNSENIARSNRLRGGEKHGRSKLSTQDVIDIRKLHADGMDCVSISKKYPVSSTQIQRIVKRQLWQSIP